MATNTYTALKTTVTTGLVSSITFDLTGITGYTDLVLVVSAATTHSSSTFLNMQFNGDTGTNYSATDIFGSGSGSVSSRDANTSSGWLGLNASIDTTLGNSLTVANILNYSNSTTLQTWLCRSSRGNNALDYFGTEALVGLWRNTAPVTSILIRNSRGGTNYNFAIGSTFSLYGISAQGALPTAKATGGDIYADSTYYYHVFDSTGVFTPSQSLSCDVVSVGGGGGGGWGNGGGGGGGEIDIYQTVSLAASAYTVTVGAGGAGGTGSGGVRGFNGVTSSLVLGGTTLVSSLGGGGGGSGDASAGNLTGATGGSGGGGNFGAAGGGASGSNTFAGGTGANSHPKYSGGGGGGATAVGANASAAVGGNGGQGYSTSAIAGLSNIFETTQVWSSGGGGGSSDINGGGVNTRGIGGTGAGSGAVSNGGTSTFTATSATSYGSGGGGGGWNGGSNATAGTGFQGIVIIRYAKA